MNDLHSQWKKEEEALFTGWDFAYLKGRIIEEKPPWYYPSLAKELVKKSEVLLDIATGGGEVLSKLAPLPRETFAIEGYEPNAKIAQKNLLPFGAKVLYTPDMYENKVHAYPFEDGKFDTVLNRHGGLNLNEIYRVLQNGGSFLTQQVSGNSLEDLEESFGEKPKWPENRLTTVIEKAKTLGFIIKQSDDWSGSIRFTDVGAIVYYLKAIPWLIDNFSVDTHIAYLDKLEERLNKDSELKFSTGRFLILAEKYPIT